MRKIRVLVLPFFLIFLLGCGLLSGVQDIRKTVSTQLPSFLTNAPTAQGVIETLAAQQSSSQCTGTPTAGGLGVGVDRAKTVLQATQQFTFTDGTVDGQPASIVTLTSTGDPTYSSIANDFSAKFIGDPCNLSRILITAPYTDQQETVDQGLAAADVLLVTFIPLDIQLPLMAWLSENYTNVPVSGQQQTTILRMQFTLSRTQSEMTLEIVPAKQ